NLVGAAWVADSLKNWEEAARLWQSCISQFPAKATVQWHHRHACALQGLNRLDEAAAVYASVTQAWPESPIGWVGLARTATLQRDWARSVERWQDCITRFEDDSDPQWYGELSTSVLKLGDHEEVLQSATILSLKALPLK